MERIAKNLTLFLFSIYGVGFIVTNFYLSYIGVNDKDVFNVDFLKAGLNFLIFIGPSILITWIVRKPYEKDVFKARWVISFLSIVVCNFLLLLLYFGLCKYKPIIYLPFLMFSILIIWVINKYLSKNKIIGTSVFVLFMLFLIFFETLISFRFGVNELTAMWIIINCTLFTWVLNAIWDKFLFGFKDKVEKVMQILILSITLVITSAIYGYTMFMHVPVIIGGGEKSYKRYIPNNDFNEIIISNYKLDSCFWNKSVCVLYESQSKVYFLINDTTLIGINKNCIDEIINYNR